MRIIDWSADVCSSDLWTLTINERLLFPSNESGLKPDQIERLGTLAHHLIAVGITTARVEGHTDSTGKSAYNQALSEARAQTVAGIGTASCRARKCKSG